LAVVVVLIYLPYAEMRYAHRIHPKLALACVIGALVVLWSILPRRDRFVPPGLRLNGEQQSLAPAGARNEPAESLLARDRPRPAARLGVRFPLHAGLGPASPAVPQTRKVRS
jgi:hypothetical protein